MSESRVVGAPSPEQTVRDAFAAFASSDRDTMLRYIAPNFRWTFFPPDNDEPIPATCTDASQVFRAIDDPNSRANWKLVEIASFGDRVVVVTAPPPGRERPAFLSGNQTFHVLEVRDGRIAAMRACLSREEAIRRAERTDESLTI